MATICAAQGYVDYADFVRDREALLREFQELPGGMSSHETYSRLFRLLDPKALESCFSQFLDAPGGDRPNVVAIDGKTLRRSFDRAVGRSALRMVTAFAAAARLLVGQVAAGDQGSEIIAAGTRLGLLALDGVLVTVDALYGQGETARLIRTRAANDCSR